MNNKQKLLTTFFLIILILLPIIFYLNQQRVPQEVGKRLVPIPLIPDEVKKQSYDFEFNIEKSDFDFPESLSQIIATPAEYSLEEIDRIANNLKITDEPKVTDDYFDGIIVTHKNDKVYLTSTIETGKLEYALHLIPELTGTKLDENELINVSSDFLKDNNLAGSQDNFVGSINYLARTSEHVYVPSNKDNSDIYQINFTPNVSSYPILTTNPSQTTTYVQILIDGTILRVVAGKFSAVEQTREIRLKSYDDVLNSSSEAVIASINKGELYKEVVTENSITKITVNEIDLAYLQVSPSNENIQPIYLLKGLAEIKKFPEPVEIILYLPAIDTN